MPNGQQFLAVDLGAESGRVMRGSLDGGRLQIAEAHRFANGPLQQGESLRWDFPKILADVKRGIARGVEQSGKNVAGTSVDSWGVDFGLLDERGELVQNPYHYRDRQTEGMFEEAFRRVPKREVYERTGIELRRINSLFQLLAMRLRRDPALDRARRLMFMADLVAHALCGETFAEYTLASTSQMADMHTGEWSSELLARLDLPAELLPRIVKPGTVVGKLTAAVAAECGCARVPVIAAASHDTGSAVAAVPAQGGGWAYLSSGTWSLAGVELKKAVITDASFAANITNEGGVEGTIRFLTSLAGLWLVQECRRQWQREGSDFSYAQLTEMARRARPFAARIRPDDESLGAPGDMPARINAQLERTGQRPLSDKGEMVRSILEAVAFTYRRTLDSVDGMTGGCSRLLHIVGGGAQNELLNQFAADATGREVITGPIEATSIGNVLIQAMAVGSVGSLAELRAVVRESFPTRRYVPVETEAWEAERRARE
jgi:sugar (pentulose or hexulose) kinase